MSMESWRAEFYPKQACTATNNWVQATEHSLRKWRGLTLEHRLRHLPEGGLPIVPSSSNCALCLRTEELQGESQSCNKCVIVHMRGHRCDEPLDLDSGDISEWDAWTQLDPRPMIELLEETLDFAKKLES